MTAHGPEAIRLVVKALDDALILTTFRELADITGTALDVIEGRSTREGAIYGLAARLDLDPRHATKLLDLAVEALTANPQE